MRELLAVYVDAIQGEGGKDGYGQYEFVGNKNAEAEKELHEIVGQIMKTKLLEKLMHLYPHMAAKVHITRCVFFILKIMLPKMER